MKAIKNFLTDKIDRLFYVPAGFKRGDTVQRISGGVLMVILSVTRSTKNSPASVVCEWYNREQKVTVKSTFLIPEIKMFDWYHPS